MIEINELTFTYKGAEKPAVDNVTMTIHDGDFYGIIGESGAGKTTLTYAISGIIPSHYNGEYRGKVTVDGNDCFETSMGELAAYIGSVLQDIDSQLVTSEVLDEMLFGLENFGVPHDEIMQRVDEALEKVGIMPLKNRSIATLSGGQKQKVAIASVIALKPKILLLDEPTGELDPQSSRQIFTLLRELNRNYGMTIVVVEQKIMLLCEFADKLAVMQGGRLMYDDSVRNVLKNSDKLLELGVNCPRAASLSNELTRRGLYSGEICINVEEAEEMVRGILK